jgi:hypothetical protein
MATKEEQGPSATSPPPQSTLEAFLQAVEQKTTDHIHHRLLRACRASDPPTELEAELNKIISEILHET